MKKKPKRNLIVRLHESEQSTIRRASFNFLLGPEESDEWISASHRITARHGKIQDQAYCVEDRRGG